MEIAPAWLVQAKDRKDTGLMTGGRAMPVKNPNENCLAGREGRSGEGY